MWLADLTLRSPSDSNWFIDTKSFINAISSARSPLRGSVSSLSLAWTSLGLGGSVEIGGVTPIILNSEGLKVSGSYAVMVKGIELPRHDPTSCRLVVDVTAD